MLGSLFALLTLSALVLLVPASVALLAVERHRHVSPGEDTRRWVRLVVGATVVALAALGVAALLRADVVAAAVVSVVLAGSVLVWAPLSRTWAVRGVVVWALLVAAAAGAVGWLGQRTAASWASGGEAVVTAVATAALLLVLWRGQGYTRDLISRQAGLGPRTTARQNMPLLRPLVSLALLLAGGGAVLAVTSGETGPGDGPPQAGPSGPASALPEPSTASTPTLGRSPVAAGADGAAAAGVVAVAEGRSHLVAAHVPEPLSLTQAHRPGTAGPGGAAPSQAPLRTMLRAGRTFPAHVLTHHATGETAASSGTGGTSPTPRAPSSGSTGLPRPGHGQPTTPAPSVPSRPVPSPPRPSAPVPAGPSRTPGYAKEKPHRPAGAPSPGHGRQHHAPTPGHTTGQNPGGRAGKNPGHDPGQHQAPATHSRSGPPLPPLSRVPVSTPSLSASARR